MFRVYVSRIYITQWFSFTFSFIFIASCFGGMSACSLMKQCRANDFRGPPWCYALNHRRDWLFMRYINAETRLYVSRVAWHPLTREQFRLSDVHHPSSFKWRRRKWSSDQWSRLAEEELWAAIFYDFLRKAQSHYYRDIQRSQRQKGTSKRTAAAIRRSHTHSCQKYFIPVKATIWPDRNWLGRFDIEFRFYANPLYWCGN